MKRPSAINTKVHGDSTDLLNNTAPSSSQTYQDEPASPSNNNGNISDSDSISDSSRLRKKRNTYQKIPDDVRVNLLEAVQNGETLKAAAKRHKINYSSAKSILHTYRKEGRILKKSAQERTMKRKGEASPDYSEEPKPTKQCKKENVQPTSTDSKASKPVNMLADKKKPLAQSASNTQNENSTSTKGKATATTTKANQEESPVKVSTETAKLQTTEQPAQKDDESSNKILPEGSHGDHAEMNNMGNMDNAHHFTTRTKRFDSFQAFMGAHFPENGTDHHHMGDSHHMFTDPFSDMMHPLHHNKNHTHDDIYHNTNYFFPQGFGPSGALEDKTGKVENGMNFDDFHFGGFADCPLKSFMDTQNLFREALRKASFFSQGGNTTGIRKDSIDFFKM